MAVEHSCSTIIPASAYIASYIASRSSNAFTLCDSVTLTFDLLTSNTFMEIISV